MTLAHATEEAVYGWWTRPDVDSPRMWDTWLAPHREHLLQALEGAPFTSLFEVGCGAGPNLRRIRQHYPALRLGGSDCNATHAAWCQSQGLDVAQRSLPHAVGPEWDVTVTCFACTYVPRRHVEQFLATCQSQALIVMEPWGRGEWISPKRQTTPRFYHPWHDMTQATGWRLDWRWPIPPADDVTSLAIFHKTPKASGDAHQ